MSSYDSDLRQFLSFLEERGGPHGVTPKDVCYRSVVEFLRKQDKFEKRVARGISGATAATVLSTPWSPTTATRRKLAAIRSFASYLRLEGLIEHDNIGLVETSWAFLDFNRLNLNRSKHTVAAYDSDLRQFLSFLEERSGPEGVTLEDVQYRSVVEFLSKQYKLEKEVSRGVSGATSARKLATIKSFARYLRRKGLLDHDTVSLVRTPRVQRTIPPHLNVRDISDLLEAPDPATALGRRDLAILELLYASGMRVSELVELDLIHVSTEERIVRVLGKGKKEREVPFNKTAAGALRTYLEEGRPKLVSSRPPVKAPGDRLREAVFLNRRGGRLSARWVSLLLKWYVSQSIKKPGIYPHVLRHAFASHLLERGADLRVIQDLLGHAGVRTTEEYLDVTDKQLARVYNQTHPRA